MYPPKEYAGKDTGDLISKNPIGTGPYKFVRWSKDEEIVLEANTGYWRGAPNIKTVVFRPIPDDAVRVAALQNGEIDLAVNIPPHLAAIIDKHPKLFLSTAPSIRTIQLMFYTHQMDAQHKPTGPVQRAHRRQARAPGHRLRDRRRRDHQERARRQGHPRRHDAAVDALRLRPEAPADQAGRRPRPRSSWPRPASAAASRSRCTARRAATCATRKSPRRCAASSTRPASRPRCGPTSS